MSALSYLGLKSGASREDIRAAYKTLARTTHPDKGGSPEAFVELGKAYRQALRELKCPTCDGKGHIKQKNGLFVKTLNCPQCWRI